MHDGVPVTAVGSLYALRDLVRFVEAGEIKVEPGQRRFGSAGVGKQRLRAARPIRSRASADEQVPRARGISRSPAPSSASMFATISPYSLGFKSHDYLSNMEW